MAVLKCYSCLEILDEMPKWQMPVRAYCESCAMDKVGA
jgi:hypothetical protein